MKCIYLCGSKVDENITVFIFPNIIIILKKFDLKPYGVRHGPSSPNAFTIADVPTMKSDLDGNLIF